MLQLPVGQTGNVRISFTGNGFWSYLGTDIMLVPKSNPTMNLQGFSMFTADSEYKRVVRHETGHTLGFPHEHLRKAIVDDIDPAQAYKWFRYRRCQLLRLMQKPHASCLIHQVINSGGSILYMVCDADPDLGLHNVCSDHDGWSKGMVDSNVLTPIDNASLLGGSIDATSIMCYYLPAEIMKDGKAVPGGLDINDADRGFATSIYPPRTTADVHPCWPKVPARRMSEVRVH